MTLKKNFRIGKLVLPNNIVYAPLAEYTDFAFRKSVREFHRGLFFCEMIKMEALVREKDCRILKYTKDMSPIGAQVCGSNPLIAKDAAKKIEDLGFDLIDLNCGCPVPKIVKDGSGSALLKDLKLLAKMLTNIKNGVGIPVTVKARLGWDESSICIKDVIRIAEDTGCGAITIHGRTRKQGYSGRADWEYIKQGKELSKNIIIIGNGDLYSAEDVKNMWDLTGCDAVMIARGMLCRPWLSQEIENYFDANGILKYSKKEFLLKYIENVMQEKGEEKTLFDIRRISGWILREEKNIKQLRIEINRSKSTKEAVSWIKDFNWS